MKKFVILSLLMASCSTYVAVPQPPVATHTLAAPRMLMVAIPKHLRVIQLCATVNGGLPICGNDVTVPLNGIVTLSAKMMEATDELPSALQFRIGTVDKGSVGAVSPDAEGNIKVLTFDQRGQFPVWVGSPGYAGTAFDVTVK